jgi:peroxiredoxin
MLTRFHCVCIGSALVMGIALSGCNSQLQKVRASQTKPPAERKKAPEFTLKDADGKTVRLSDYRGKVLLVNFWATWCAPCRIEIPWFIEFEKKYKDQGFAVLGVSMDEDGWDAVKPYLARAQINYRVLLGDDITAQSYGGVESMPTSFVVDKEGKVASVHVGLINKSDYENEIKSLLE